MNTKLKAAVFFTPRNSVGAISFVAHFFDGDDLSQTLKLTLRDYHGEAFNTFRNFVTMATAGRCTFCETGGAPPEQVRTEGAGPVTGNED